MVKNIKRSNFSGAITTIGGKVGTENSAKFIKGLNIFEDPSYVTLARATTKISSTTIDDVPLWMVDGSPWNTNRYVYTAAGEIFQVNSSDSVSSLRTVSGSSGEGMVIHNNALYYAQATEIGRYFPLNNSPSFNDSFANWWIDSQLTDTGGGTGASDYVPPTSISESATALQSFTAGLDPIKSITINIDVVGTGDWTVTLHNANNDSLGTSTIVNGSMSTGDVIFTLSSVGRVKIGETYHFHVTSTVADGGVDTSTGTDLEAASYTITYGTLISTDYHPMVEFLNGFVFGNERYIGYFDDATYNPCKIELAPGFQVRDIVKVGEYIVATAWRGENFEEAEECRHYIWDGIEPVFNFFNDVKVGTCNALINHENTLYGIYGNRGALYQGGEAENATFTQITDGVPKLARGKSVEVYPGGMDTFEGNLLIAYAGNNDDTTDVELGVYEYGSQTDSQTQGLSFPFIISTGNTNNTNQKISLIKSFGEDLYTGWRDNSSYGLDKITAGDNAIASGVFEDRIFDKGDPDKLMQAIKIEITFVALAANQSVTGKYKLDRASSFTSGSAESTVGATRLDLYINTLCREIEWGFTIASSDGTFPKVTGINYIYDDLDTESDEG